MTNAAEAVTGSRTGLWLPALLPLLLAGGLLAQTAPLPVLPPQPEPSPGPESPGEAQPVPGRPGEAQQRPQPWEYAQGLGGGWDSNIDFRVPDGAGGASRSRPPWR